MNWIFFISTSSFSAQRFRRALPEDYTTEDEDRKNLDSIFSLILFWRFLSINFHFSFQQRSVSEVTLVIGNGNLNFLSVVVVIPFLRQVWKRLIRQEKRKKNQYQKPFFVGLVDWYEGRPWAFRYLFFRCQRYDNDGRSRTTLGLIRILWYLAPFFSQ